MPRLHGLQQRSLWGWVRRGHTIDRFRGGRASLVSRRRTRALFHVFRPHDRDGRGRANVQDDMGIGWGQGKRQRVEDKRFVAPHLVLTWTFRNGLFLNPIRASRDDAPATR